MNTLPIHHQQTVNKIKRTIQPRNPRKGPGSVSCFLLRFSQQNSCNFLKTTFFRAERSANINILLLFPWLSNLTCSKRKGFTQFVKNRLYIASATQLMITKYKMALKSEMPWNQRPQRLSLCARCFGTFSRLVRSCRSEQCARMILL